MYGAPQVLKELAEDGRWFFSRHRNFHQPLEEIHQMQSCTNRARSFSPPACTAKIQSALGQLKEAKQTSDQLVQFRARDLDAGKTLAN